MQLRTLCEVLVGGHRIDGAVLTYCWRWGCTGAFMALLWLHWGHVVILPAIAVVGLQQ